MRICEQRLSLKLDAIWKPVVKDVNDRETVVGLETDGRPGFVRD